MSRLCVNLEVPDEWAFAVAVGRHSVQRLNRPASELAENTEPITVGRGGRLLRLDSGLVVVNRTAHVPPDAERVLVTREPLSELVDGVRLLRDQLRWAVR